MGRIISRPGLPRLTRREMEVLNFLCAGWRDPIRIGDELGLSYSTINRYIARIARKWKTLSKAKMVSLAIRHEVIELGWGDWG